MLCPKVSATSEGRKQVGSNTNGKSKTMRKCDGNLEKKENAVTVTGNLSKRNQFNCNEFACAYVLNKLGMNVIKHTPHKSHRQNGLK